MFDANVCSFLGSSARFLVDGLSCLCIMNLSIVLLSFYILYIFSTFCLRRSIRRRTLLDISGSHKQASIIFSDLYVCILVGLFI